MRTDYTRGELAARVKIPPYTQASILAGATILALMPLLAARASDWVEDEKVNTRPVRPMVMPSPVDSTPSATEDGAFKVTDPGSPGTAPDQRHSLEGGVMRNGYTNPLGVPTDSLVMQSPMPAPQTRLVSPKMFQSWLQETHPDLGVHTKEEVVEVKGQWDDSGHALHNFGLSCTKLGSGRLTDAVLNNAKIVVVDCAGNLQAPELLLLQKFVRDGGFLITTDWALDGCLTRAFPGYVEWNGGYSPSEIVDANVVEPRSILVAGTVPRAYWKLDAKCQTVKIRRPEVQVLVRSRQLMRDDPDNLGVLCFTFRYGKGHVLHLVGHFDNNSDRAFNNALPDPAPRIGISLRQAIAANFVAAALKSKGDSGAGKGDLGAGKGDLGAGKGDLGAGKGDSANPE